MDVVPLENMTLDDIRKSIQEAVDKYRYHINDDEICELISRAWTEMCKINTHVNNTCNFLKLICNAQIKHNHTHEFVLPNMVPDANSSIELSRLMAPPIVAPAAYVWKVSKTTMEH